MGDTGSYLYAMCRGVTDADFVGVAGLGQRPLRVVAHRGLAAVVSDVPLDEFGEDGMRQHLEDLTWLEDVARTHDAVVMAAASLAPTAPLRLATICLTDQSVRERLDAWHDPLVRTLDKVARHQEWSVKAFTRTPTSEPATANPVAAGAAGQGSGAEYLKRRKAEAEQRERAGERAAELADQIHGALTSSAAEGRRLTPQDPRLTGHDGTMLLNGAYLVPDAGVAEFQSAVQELGAANADVRLELQGPWPPYSFVSMEDR